MYIYIFMYREHTHTKYIKLKIKIIQKKNSQYFTLIYNITSFLGLLSTDFQLHHILKTIWKVLKLHKNVCIHLLRYKLSFPLTYLLPFLSANVLYLVHIYFYQFKEISCFAWSIYIHIYIYIYIYTVYIYIYIYILSF